MSTTEPMTDTSATEDPERGLLHRTYAAELSSGDGRTVDVRIVPYGERIQHNDGRGGLPKGVMYDEEWVAGAFDDQVRGAKSGRARHVLVNFEHQGGIGGVVGHGLMLREASDGFYGSFKIHETPDGDKALMLIREGVLDSVSLEALPKKSLRSRDGVVQRVKAHLFGIALARFGAYPGARVLALREDAIVDEPVIDASLLPLSLDPGLVERCRLAGVKLPQRYEAHPAENGHPGQSGTPEDGTRPTEPTSSEGNTHGNSQSD